ncbi:MAG: NAD-dependent epimerase/dehydratase family protein [Candidatus Desulfofervidaceae bacterium]|nr:NAD-dependent epimerase/dehydratase family protein [Candidatus Desulfofervidaceae bacterium]
MKQILVTGATGFIGSHLIEGLLQKGHEVYCLARNKKKLRWLQNLPVNLVVGDCQNLASLNLPSVSVVYHLAGLVKAKSPVHLYQANYLGTLNLIRAILRQRLPLEKFVFVSTLAVHGNPQGEIITSQAPPCPLTHYAKSKWMAEQALLSLKELLPVIIFRPTAIYGPRDKEFLEYMRLVKHGFAPILNPKGTLSLCYVADLIEALMAVLDRNVPSGKVFLLSDGKVYSWQTVITTMANMLGKQPLLIKVPKPLTLSLALAAEFYNHFAKEPLMFSRDKLKEVFQKTWFCDISDAQTFLDFQPKYSLKKGMEITIRWYQQHNWL